MADIPPPLEADHMREKSFQRNPRFSTYHLLTFLPNLAVTKIFRLISAARGRHQSIAPPQFSIGFSLHVFYHLSHTNWKLIPFFGWSKLAKIRFGHALADTMMNISPATFWQPKSVCLWQFFLSKNTPPIAYHLKVCDKPEVVHDFRFVTKSVLSTW